MANAFGPLAGSIRSPTSNSARYEQALGLKAIYSACKALYPDQPTPLQVTALRKYWMGGPDPLDFINMYANHGSGDRDSPPHWHFVTNGLSDLYGDSRLHSHSASSEDPSGFGFELTLRVRREPDESKPPTWPAHLLQSIARYIFHSQAQLMVGDHIPWPAPLDKQPLSCESPTQSNEALSETNVQSIAMAAAAAAASLLASSRAGSDKGKPVFDSETYASMVSAALNAVNSSKMRSSTSRTSGDGDSRIHHMLVIEDPQLRKISTPYGYVQFLQLVGLCNEELRLVQRWTGLRVQKLLADHPETGGSLLVTDMRRKMTLFELEPKLTEFVNEQLRREGSSLSGVTTQYFTWGPITLAMMNDPIPGELEARQYECVNMQSKCGSAADSFPLHHTRNGVNASYSDAPSVSPQKLTQSNEPTAMDVDETVLSSSTKKDADDDDFVDVVGDSASSSILTCGESTEKANTRNNEKESSEPVSNTLTVGHDVESPKRFLSDEGCTESKKMALDATALKTAEDAPAGSISSPCSSELTPGPATYQSVMERFEGHPTSRPSDLRGLQTPGSVGEGSAPCTPLAHLSLSPSSLDMYPTRTIDCLDVHLCREAAEMLPLAVSDRLRHGKHFTFLNAHFPDHAITLVPTGVSGSFVSEGSPYVARGPWLQILIPDDFLERLEIQFSMLNRSDELQLPLVFRWPSKRLRLCLVDVPDNLTAASGTMQHGSRGFTSPVCDKTSAQLRPHPSRSKNLHGLGTPDQSPMERSPTSISSPTFSMFPPGFVPPPPMLAAAFGTSRPKCDVADGAQQPNAIPPYGGFNQSAMESAMANWFQMLSNTANVPGRAPSVPEAYQAALIRLQQQMHRGPDAHANR